jgi:hypothetical protein
MPGQGDEEEPVRFEQYSVTLHVPTITPPHGVKEPHWPDPLSPPQPRNKTKISKSDFRMKLSLIGAEQSTPSSVEYEMSKVPGLLSGCNDGD